ncbi:hypothetical protein LTR37_015903 [Vermiconidia calcicola]|uniref:Uncharacterized protein n=1 Tax=Vermiconidia calcicola TaxID=1690605 RepID=A0ACC3MPS3_9PEZI|nr:hypothetical protein LTR37_015903 [Vermiconidia calcicola]
MWYRCRTCRRLHRTLAAARACLHHPDDKDFDSLSTVSRCRARRAAIGGHQPAAAAPVLVAVLAQQVNPGVGLPQQAPHNPPQVPYQQPQQLPHQQPGAQDQGQGQGQGQGPGANQDQDQAQDDQDEAGHQPQQQDDNTQADDDDDAHSAATRARDFVHRWVMRLTADALPDPDRRWYEDRFLRFCIFVLLVLILWLIWRFQINAADFEYIEKRRRDCYGL